jgi:AcrR family transcriptional regulator
MAKSGTPSKVAGRGGARSVGTRRLLVDAAIETLKSEGYAGASARAIAERAGSHQGLIFYHFGSVANLLLAALDSVSAARLEQYGESVTNVGTPRELVDAATYIFGKDLDAGYITVLVEMIAGASSTPGLGDEVAARIGPWKEFAQAAVENSFGDSPLGNVLPSKDVAHAIVALYLGLEMLSHLDGDREPALALFAHAKQLSGLFEAMASSTATKETT